MPANADRRARLSHVLTAPVVALYAPRLAGLRLRRAGWPIAIVCLLAVGTVVGTINGVGIWAYEVIDAEWSVLNFLRDEPFPSFAERTAFIIEQARTPTGRFDLAAYAAAGSAFYTCILLGLALVALYRTSATDSLAAALRRALLSAFGGAGLLIVWVIGSTAAALLSEFTMFLIPFLLVGFIIPIVSMRVLVAVGRVADGTCPRRSLQRAPTCADCGYDLTTHAPEERCPECGRPVADSLADKPGKPPTLFGILFRPTQYYRTLPVLRDTSRGASFARDVQLSLFFAAPLAAIPLAIPDGAAVTILMLLVTLWTLALLQWAHGLVAGAAVILIRLTQPLPDDRRLRRCVPYEWAFAWPLAIFWGGTYLALRFGFDAIIGPSAVGLWIVGGTAGFGLAWLVRYRRIADAIRWSNV